MKIVRRTFLIFVFFIGLASPGLAKTAKSDLTAKSEKILALLNANVVTLDQPIYLFHWEAIHPDSPKTFEVEKAFSRALATNFLSGLYLATDPAVSLNYGAQTGDAWRLVVVELPKGYRYLDFGQRSRGKTMHALSEIIGDGDCAWAMMNVSSSYSNKPKYKEQETCTVFRNRLIEKLKVGAIRYPFGATVDIEGCSGSDLSAFVGVSSQGLAPSAIRVFDHGSSDTGAEDLQNIQQLIAESRAAKMVVGGKFAISARRDLWPNLPVSEKPNEGHLAWRKRFLVNCQ